MLVDGPRFAVSRRCASAYWIELNRPLHPLLALEKLQRGHQQSH